MKWEEVRLIYPNQFVKLHILESEIHQDEEIVKEMAVIGIVSEKEATRELLNSKENEVVYHTSHERIALKIRGTIGLRGKLRHAD